MLSMLLDDITNHLASQTVTFNTERIQNIEALNHDILLESLQ